MNRQKPFVAFAAALLITLVSVASLAQQPLDRAKPPTPGPNPTLHVPTWTKSQLPNGATLIVSERRGLPLVSFNITFIGGGNQFEPAGKRGVAALTTSMLTEGTRQEPAINCQTRCRCSALTSAPASVAKKDPSVLFRRRKTLNPRWRSSPT